MRRLATLPAMLATLSAQASAAVSIESATGEWSKLPVLSQRGYEHLNEKMQAKLFEIAESKQCPGFVLSQGRLDFRINFATQYDSSGTLNRLILPQLNCTEAESVAGGALLEMLQAGDYAPTGKSPNGWYQGQLGFNFVSKSALAPAVVKPTNAQTQKLASNTPDPNEIVCEKIEEIGSRLSFKRVCMSRSEWDRQKRLTRDEIDRAQQQRGCRDVC